MTIYLIFLSSYLFLVSPPRLLFFSLFLIYLFLNCPHAIFKCVAFHVIPLLIQYFLLPSEARFQYLNPTFIQHHQHHHRHHLSLLSGSLFFPISSTFIFNYLFSHRLLLFLLLLLLLYHLVLSST